jgi:hypothetical protein
MVTGVQTCALPICVLQAIADDDKSSTSDKIKAIDLLGKYGGLQQIDATSNDEPIQPNITISLADSGPMALASAIESLEGSDDGE